MKRDVNVLAIVALGLLAGSARADDHIAARVWAGAVGRFVLHDNATFDDPMFDNVAMKIDGTGIGVGADLEYRLHRYVGIDAAIGYTRLGVAWNSSTEPDTTHHEAFSAVPVLLAANLHPIQSRKIDLWFGPQVGVVFYPQGLTVSTSANGTFKYAPTHATSLRGFDLGADIPIREHTAVNVAFRWQNADGDSDGHLTIDPTFVTTGLTRQF